MSNHCLDNMIYNLENRKELKKVDFSQKALVEVLDYLKELQKKDQRIAELEKALKMACERIEEVLQSESDIVGWDYNYTKPEVRSKIYLDRARREMEIVNNALKVKGDANE